MSVATRDRPPISVDEQQSRLRSLEREIPLGTPRTRLPIGEEVVRLCERYKEVQRPACVFQRSFTEFRAKLCWTKDEARSRVARMPDWPYLREIDERLLSWSKPLLIEKSRRTLISWELCCFDVWICAGGQDRRWPSLMNSTGYRQVIIAAQKADGLNSSDWFLQERVKFILEQFEQRGLRRFWPDFPRWQAKQYHISFSNGSTMDAIPQGPSQARGPGATFCHVEELSVMDQAGPTINAMLPVLRGGGRLCAICTPMAGTYAQRIRDGRLSQKR